MKYLVTLLVLALGESAAWAAATFLHVQGARVPADGEPASLWGMALAGAGMLLTIVLRCRAAGGGR